MQTMPLAGRTIEKDLFIAAAPERVYRAFTTKEDLERWFVTNANVDARPGGAFTFAEQQSTQTWEFIDLDPPRGLSFTWNDSQDSPKPRITTCAIEFIPEADGTLLRLTHTGFSEGADWDEVYSEFNGGWTEELGNLKTWLETGAEKSWT